ncbi:MAG: hypothetical protein ACI88A_005099 [Paraglaciecola sp.]|jgi:hypothetical protein
MLNKNISFLLYAFIFIFAPSCLAQSTLPDCPDPSAYNCGNGSGSENGGLAAFADDLEILLAGGIIAGALVGIYYLTSDDNEASEEYTTKMLVHYNQGKGLRLTAFDNPIDVSLFSLNQQNTHNKFDSNSLRENVFTVNPSKNRISVTLANLSIKW